MAIKKSTITLPVDIWTLRLLLNFGAEDLGWFVHGEGDSDGHEGESDEDDLHTQYIN